MTSTAEKIAQALRDGGYVSVNVWDKRGVRVYFSETVGARKPVVRECGYVEVVGDAADLSTVTSSKSWASQVIARAGIAAR